MFRFRFLVLNYLKIYFQNISEIITGKLEKSGQWEVFDYINELGGSPLTSGALWIESNFSLKKWFLTEPDFVGRVLFNHKIVRCPARFMQKLCLEYGSVYFYDELLRKDIEYIMQNLQKLEKDVKNEASNNFLEFLLLRNFFKNQVLRNNLSKSEHAIISIVDLRQKFPDIDWLQGINKQLLKHSRVPGEEKVVIVEPQIFDKFYKEAITYNKT